jgi:hypothetical protein
MESMGLSAEKRTLGLRLDLDFLNETLPGSGLWPVILGFGILKSPNTTAAYFT